MTEAKRVAIYTRVSTDGQSVENQRRELRLWPSAVAGRSSTSYSDHGISGFDRMLKDATRGEFDMIAAWSVDRLGRSLQHLVSFLGEIHASGVDLYLHQQALDTATPAGKAMFQMCGGFAEFERAMIVERVNAGLKRARAAGKMLGRPKIDANIEASIRKALAKGAKGILRIAAEFGVGSGTVQRIKAAA
jgi:DNA invertase Pin-like site-specific DNA recombinase